MRGQGPGLSHMRSVQVLHLAEQLHATSARFDKCRAMRYQTLSDAHAAKINMVRAVSGRAAPPYNQP